jgi:hypothetical protein
MMLSVIARLRSLAASSSKFDRPFTISEAILQELEPLTEMQRLRRQVDALTKRVGSAANPIQVDSDNEDDDVVAMDPEVIKAAAALEQAKASAMLRKQSKAAGPGSTGGGSPARSSSNPHESGAQADDEGEDDVVELGPLGGATQLDEALLSQVMAAMENIVRADPCDDATFAALFKLKGSESPLEKETQEARNAAITLALPKIRVEMSAVVAKTGAKRTRAAKGLVMRLHREMSKHDPSAQLALLRAYTPVLQPLLPADTDLCDEHYIARVGVLDGVKAKAIADLAKAPARV